MCLSFTDTHTRAHTRRWGAGLQTTQLHGEAFWKVKGTQNHTDNCKYYCDRRNLSETPVGDLTCRCARFRVDVHTCERAFIMHRHIHSCTAFLGRAPASRFTFPRADVYAFFVSVFHSTEAEAWAASDGTSVEVGTRVHRWRQSAQTFGGKGTGGRRAVRKEEVSSPAPLPMPTGEQEGSQRKRIFPRSCATGRSMLGCRRFGGCD